MYIWRDLEGGGNSRLHKIRTKHRLSHPNHLWRAEMQACRGRLFKKGKSYALQVILWMMMP